MLTEKRIRDASPEGRPYFLWDEKTKGLAVRVFKTGVRTFVLSYRDSSGRKRLVTLGRVGELTLKDARERASAERLRVLDGEASLIERRREVRLASTVTELWDRFATEFAPERIAVKRMTERTLREYRKQSRRHLLPALGQLKVRDVRRVDIERMAHAMKHIPSQRNRVLALASRLFNLAETWELRPQHSNPVRGVVRAKEEARDRTLTESELAALGRALDTLADAFPAAVGAIRVAALTGFRASEAAGIRWQDVNSERGVIVLPATKTGRQTRAVPRAALDVIGAMPRVNGCDAVFTTKGKVSIAYKHMREVFARACEQAGLEDARLHDLRRTIATRIAGAGTSLTVLRDVLGHASVTMSARYARMADSAVKAAIEATGGEIAAAMEPRRG
ncbi:MAG: site-specific integrase [Rhodospirillales bacterium]|nr:site-specific integrase [Rhodospirillales bacterium]